MADERETEGEEEAMCVGDGDVNADEREIGEGEVACAALSLSAVAQPPGGGRENVLKGFFAPEML